jgi:peptidoglycan/LPS O-acetylase OafA/YrhL
MRAPASTSHRFLVLDGMRGAAALLVITDHIPSAIADAFPARTLAVDFFFILSGFVLAHAYSHRLSAGLSAPRFMAMRLIRLYPLYLLGASIGLADLVLSRLSGEVLMSRYVFAAIAATSAVFAPTPPFHPSTGAFLYPAIAPAWSLFFELVANAAFASIALLRREAVLRVFLPVAALVLIAAGVHYASSDLGWSWPLFPGGFARVGFTFFVGVFLYGVWKRGRTPAIPPWLAFASLFAVTAGAGLTDGHARVIYSLAAQLVALPALVLLSAGSQVNGAAARVCATLGALSYGVYILHAPLLRLWNLAVSGVFGAPPPGSFNVVFIAVVALLAAAIAGRFYDEPARAWLKRRLLRPRAEPA